MSKDIGLKYVNLNRYSTEDPDVKTREQIYLRELINYLNDNNTIVGFFDVTSLNEHSLKNDSGYCQVPNTLIKDDSHITSPTFCHT